MATIKEKVDQRLKDQQSGKEFQDIGRVSNTKKERSAYKLITIGSMVDLEQDPVMAFNMVKKENVWPVINIDLEKGLGTTAGAAYLKVKIRESLPAKPKNDPAYRMAYVKFLTYMQEAFKTIYTVAGLKEFQKTLRGMPMETVIDFFISDKFQGLPEAEKQEELIKIKSDPRFRFSMMYGAESFLKKLIKEYFGARFENMIFNYSDASHAIWRESEDMEELTEEDSAILVSAYKEKQHRIIDANKEKMLFYKDLSADELKSDMLRNFNFSSYYLSEYKKDIELFRAWAISFYERRVKLAENALTNVPPKLLAHPDDWSWATKEQDGESVTKKPKSAAINSKPPLSYIKRTGGVKINEISVKQIIDLFGFKAANYGNYVDDKWSKEHTRHFLGAVSDLAEMMDVNVKQLNELGGLSIAFGAKGHPGHLATYFPQTKDINLTKGNGDGSLAHEYGHYFDNMIVELSKKEPVSRYASDGALPKTDQDSELRRLFSELMNFFTKGKPDVTPLVPIRFYAAEQKSAPSFYVGENYTVSLESTIDETIAKYSKLAVMNGNLYQTQLRVYGYIIHAFGLEDYQIPFKLPCSYYYLKSAYSEFQFCYKGEKGIMQSIQARTKYWTSPVELFARAWETVMLKKLTDKGRHSNYLVADISLEDIVVEGYNKPYPTGDELLYIEQIIDDILDAFKERFKIGDFVAMSNIREDEYLDLGTSKSGKVDKGLIVDKKYEEVVEVVAIDDDKPEVIESDTHQKENDTEEDISALEIALKYADGVDKKEIQESIEALRISLKYS